MEFSEVNEEEGLLVGRDTEREDFEVALLGFRDRVETLIRDWLGGPLGITRVVIRRAITRGRREDVAGTVYWLYQGQYLAGWRVKYSGYVMHTRHPRVNILSGVGVDEAVLGQLDRHLGLRKLGSNSLYEFVRGWRHCVPLDACLTSLQRLMHEPEDSWVRVSVWGWSLPALSNIEACLSNRPYSRHFTHFLVAALDEKGLFSECFVVSHTFKKGLRLIMNVWCFTTIEGAEVTLESFMLNWRTLPRPPPTHGW